MRWLRAARVSDGPGMIPSRDAELVAGNALELRFVEPNEPRLCEHDWDAPREHGKRPVGLLRAVIEQCVEIAGVELPTLDRQRGLNRPPMLKKRRRSEGHADRQRAFINSLGQRFVAFHRRKATNRRALKIFSPFRASPRSGKL